METYPPFLLKRADMIDSECGLNKLAKITAVLGSSFGQVNGYTLYAGSL